MEQAHGDNARIRSCRRRAGVKTYIHGNFRLRRVRKRGKSFGEILEQAERIANNPRATASRIAAADIAADRYTDNIMRQKSFRRGGQDAYNTRYSRNTYMGNNGG